MVAFTRRKVSATKTHSRAAELLPRHRYDQQLISQFQQRCSAVWWLRRRGAGRQPGVQPRRRSAAVGVQRGGSGPAGRCVRPTTGAVSPSRHRVRVAAADATTAAFAVRAAFEVPRIATTVAFEVPPRDTAATRHLCARFFAESRQKTDVAATGPVYQSSRRSSRRYVKSFDY